MALADHHGEVLAAWERSLAFAVAVHDVIVAGDRVLGCVSPQYPAAREAVVDVIDAAVAGGVSGETIDVALARIRVDADAALVRIRVDAGEFAS